MQSTQASSRRSENGSSGTGPGASSRRPACDLYCPLPAAHYLLPYCTRCIAPPSCERCNQSNTESAVTVSILSANLRAGG